MSESMQLLSLGLYPGQTSNVDWDIEFWIPGNPKTLKRHRTIRRGNTNIEYDPSQGDKADFFNKALLHRPDAPMDEPLYLYVWAYFVRPKSHFRTGKNSHLLKDSAPYWYTSTPDRDNILKFICDALNGIFWKDDKVICGGMEFKAYGDVPGVAVKIFRLNKLSWTNTRQISSP